MVQEVPSTVTHSIRLPFPPVSLHFSRFLHYSARNHACRLNPACWSGWRAFAAALAATSRTRPGGRRGRCGASLRPGAGGTATQPGDRRLPLLAYAITPNGISEQQAARCHHPLNREPDLHGGAATVAQIALPALSAHVRPQVRPHAEQGNRDQYVARREADDEAVAP